MAAAGAQQPKMPGGIPHCVRNDDPGVYVRERRGESPRTWQETNRTLGVDPSQAPFEIQGKQGKKVRHPHIGVLVQLQPISLLVLNARRDSSLRSE